MLFVCVYECMPALRIFRSNSIAIGNEYGCSSGKMHVLNWILSLMNKSRVAVLLKLVSTSLSFALSPLSIVFVYASTSLFAYIERVVFFLSLFSLPPLPVYRGYICAIFFLYQTQ